MDDFVLDASVGVALALGEVEAGPWEARFTAGRPHVPALWHLELGNALMMSERRGRISAAGLDGMLERLAGLGVETDEGTTASAWGASLALARQHRLTLYDACYLELAMRLGLPLASLDRALKAAATAEGVPLLP